MTNEFSTEEPTVELTEDELPRTSSRKLDIETPLPVNCFEHHYLTIAGVTTAADLVTDTRYAWTCACGLSARGKGGMLQCLKTFLRHYIKSTTT